MRFNRTKIRFAFFLGCFFLFLSSIATAQNVKNYIPEKAYLYLATLDSERNRLFPNGPETSYYASLIEHESCISLTHKRCWDPSSKLATKRETGAGLVQITKAYKADGSIRFDKLTEMANNYQEELRELSWDNVYSRPDLQLRVGILLTKENWDRLFMVKNLEGRLGMTDSAYNGGYSDVNKARIACGLKDNCDPQLWFDNVELVLPKSTKPLYGTRSAKDINQQHVHDVLKIRLPKYQKYFQSQGG